ncbi:alpha/beta hydrolase, partial [Pseudomonas aeruginosa]
LVAGARDTVVSTERSSVGLARRLRDAGVPVRLRVFDELNHATAVGALARPLRGLAPVRQEVLDFVATARSGRA